MVEYTEEEQLERIRQWVREYGLFLVLGVVVGLLALFGWRTYETQRVERTQQASLLYQQILSGNGDAGELLQGLKTDYAGTPYAVMAALQVSAEAARQSDWERARQTLQWAAGEAGPDELRALARYRLAQAQWALGDAELALKTLSGEVPGGFSALFAELRGDVLIGEGRPEEAAKAYRQALAADDGGDTRFVRLKLDALATPALSEGQ